jgi:4-hydroxybenzoate polyprenyltransferase
MPPPSAPSLAESSGVPWPALARLIRLRSQTGTALLVLPTLWSLVIASHGMPPLRLVAIFVAGSFLMRSAGVILNDLADQEFDREVTRTKMRPLASGELSRATAWLLLTILLAAAGSLVLWLDPLVLELAPAAVGLAALYPFSKRWLHVPQAMLGVAFGWGTVMAWAGVRGRLDVAAWCLFAATAAWAIGYDTIYALQDRQDDSRIGVKSAVLFFGSSTWLAVGAALCTMLVLLGTAGWLAEIGWPYYAGLAGVGIFFARQVAELRRPVDPPRAFALFRAHVWAGVIILTGAVAGFLA